MGLLKQAKEIFKVWDLALAVGLAFAAYFMIVGIFVGLLRIMPQQMGRLVSENDFIQRRLTLSDSPPIAFLGSSVTVEGIDCHVIDAELHTTYQSYNLAWNGASPRQLLLVSPHLVAVRPRTIVLCVDAAPVAEDTKILPIELALASWWNLVPPADQSAFAQVLTPNELAQLRQSGFVDLLVFRSLLPAALDAYFRETVRKDLRFDQYLTDFKAPWVQRARIDPTAFDKHLRLLSGRIAVRNEAKWAARFETLRFLIGYFRDHGCTVTLALAPLHPLLGGPLREQHLQGVRRELASLSNIPGVSVHDCSDLLGDEDFSDAVHASASGRQKWSQRLGQDLLLDLTR